MKAVVRGWGLIRNDGAMGTYSDSLLPHVVRTRKEARELLASVRVAIPDAKVVRVTVTIERESQS
jgi:hypothetical protein